MLKNISNLEGSKKLTANEQKAIQGAGPRRELCPGDVIIVSCVYPLKCTEGGPNGWYCS
ncbi:hypothetical protein NAT51_18845 [Flavobacterium amniphilum]|uniref:hypothetical protein n=1 Tax=Flavobacterium amniphilum TaxID=1834035 RepID=UPI00202A5CDB|nr:hypothetical protein [Flavobacterium amniphilum]MCL9807588.1 hypothetical protein [Flavobacterium amniphilum]